MVKFDTKHEEAAFLMEMCSVYPGDPDGSIMRYVYKLLDLQYEPVEVEVTYY